MEMKTKEASSLFTLAERQLSRRKFMRFASLLGVSAAVIGGSTALTGCSKDDTDENNVNLGSGDIGILNYAYALEQLEAAFYMRAAESRTAGFSDSEMALITDIRDHEIAHREFFKTALGSNAIKNLEFDFSGIGFGSRTSILNTAKAFEDLGVAAYNGAGKLIQDANYLLLAGKIVSVEARHAAYIRDLIAPNSFAASDVVDANGLDKAMTPADVLAIAGNYITTRIDASSLPS
ncbi:MAG TPA: ferritin-like domain-containing protein [Flavisolibacter sp.]|jgi:hypothetical protein|nr:ferritin-like domain-containing protein [Flavisolibacter sp.]